MTLKNRITTGAVGLVLAVGGVLAVPAAASADELQQHVSTGHASLAACEFAQAQFKGVLAGGGGTIHGGEPCLQYADGTWGYSLLYKY